ncbi:hypothetical protein GCM10023116_19590 [Kistimonas scapharcae]|uniref:Uncharacterized protein n=1 Tax=Kistimonas scapharcae TaxID=1036133 RepID=A0ABP8V0R5_9GAMM
MDYLEHWEYEELACRVCGLDANETDRFLNDHASVDELLDDKLDIPFAIFLDIAKALLPFTPLVRTAVSDELFHAFIDVKDHRTIVRMPYVKHEKQAL